MLVQAHQSPFTPGTPTVSNVLLFQPRPSTRPLKFSPGERAALIALAYAHPVTVAFEVDGDGSEAAAVLPDDEGWEVATAYLVPDGVWVRGEARNNIGTFRTPHALSAALRDHLARLGLGSGRRGSEGV